MTQDKHRSAHSRQQIELIFAPMLEDRKRDIFSLVRTRSEDRENNQMAAQQGYRAEQRINQNKLNQGTLTQQDEDTQKEAGIEAGGGAGKDTRGHRR